MLLGPAQYLSDHRELATVERQLACLYPVMIPSYSFLLVFNGQPHRRVEKTLQKYRPTDVYGCFQQKVWMDQIYMKIGFEMI